MSKKYLRNDLTNFRDTIYKQLSIEHDSKEENVLIPNLRANQRLKNLSYICFCNEIKKMTNMKTVRLTENNNFGFHQNRDLYPIFDAYMF